MGEGGNENKKRIAETKQPNVETPPSPSSNRFVHSRKYIPLFGFLYNTSGLLSGLSEEAVFSLNRCALAHDTARLLNRTGDASMYGDGPC